VKKLIILALLLVAYATIVQAAMEPSRPYCEHQGYTFDEGNQTPNTMYCVFNEENKCHSMDFFKGDCGQEFVREFPCRLEGEHMWPQFEECCEGLIPSNQKHKGYWGKMMLAIGQPNCQPIPNFFDRYLKYSLLFWLTVLAVFVFIFFRVYKKIRSK